MTQNPPGNHRKAQEATRHARPLGQDVTALRRSRHVRGRPTGPRGRDGDFGDVHGFYGEKPAENHGKTMGKWRLTLGKPWEHRFLMEKP